MPIRRYFRGVGLSHVQTQDNETYHAYHQDEQGSTAYVTGQGRESENIYQYDAFGNLIEQKATIENRILYTGQQYDQETGQYYLRARYYNPVVGRFLQEDNYRGDGLNLYAYCANNPVVYYDPSGYDGCDKTTQANSGKNPSNNIITDPARLLETTKKPEDHHIIPAFRGKSKPYADFIRSLGIDVDQYTVTVSGGKRWNAHEFYSWQGKVE